MNQEFPHRDQIYINLKKCSESEVFWYPMDTEELYKKNLKENYQTLEKFGWIGRNFTYKFNDQGFRSDPFSNDQAILFLGCSFTFGVGLPRDNVWTYLVANELKLSCWNLGVPGAANDTLFRFGSYYVPKLRPKLVVALVPGEHRFEIFNGDGPYCFLPNQVQPDCYENFYQDWILHYPNTYLNKAKNIMAIKYVCQENDIPFLYFEIPEFPLIDPARDLAHGGIQSNLEFSKKVLERIASLKTL